MSLYLGLDMSTKSSGYAIIDKETKKLVKYGCWKVKASIEWRTRCIQMGEKLNDLLNEYMIEKIVCEDTIGTSNIRTVKQLSTLQGVVLGVITSNNKSVEFIPPSSWRSKINGLYTGDRKGTTREEMKYKTCNFVNKEYGLNLFYDIDHPHSVKCEDDMGDAIAILHSYLYPKEIKTIGRKSNIN